MKTIQQTVLICMVLLIMENRTFAQSTPAGIPVQELPTIYNHLLAEQNKVEMQDWDEVDKLIPKYSTFKIVDVDTGVFFHVQRRAGDSHADVQPLTAADTKIMKQIYDGKWSWRRKAILVITKNRTIAASMNGMPHGFGALQNDFPGHFCVHFLKSTTHQSNKEDFSHQLMILKAAGKISDFVSTATSEEVIHTLIAAIQQGDPFILSQVVSNKDGDEAQILKKIVSVRLLNDLLPSHSFVLLNEVPVEVIYNNGKHLKNKKEMLRIERASLSDPWLVNVDLLMESLP